MHMSRMIGENLVEFFVFLWMHSANNSKAVIRASDIFTAALPTRISNLRRLVIAVQRAPKFSRGGLKFAINCVFDRKLRDLASSFVERECPMLAHIVEGGSEISPPPPILGALPRFRTRQVF